MVRGIPRGHAGNAWVRIAPATGTEVAGCPGATSPGTDATGGGGGVGVGVFEPRNLVAGGRFSFGVANIRI